MDASSSHPQRAPSITRGSDAFKSCPSCSLPLSSVGLEGLPGDSQRLSGPLARGSWSLPESASSLDTYDDEQDEIDEVVERVSIHHVVHDLHPAFQSDHLRPEQSRRDRLRRPSLWKGRQRGKRPRQRSPRAPGHYTCSLSYFSRGLHWAGILIPNMQVRN